MNNKKFVTKCLTNVHDEKKCTSIFAEKSKIIDSYIFI